MSGGYTVLGDQEVTSRKIDLTWATDYISASETTTSTSYANLSTTGPTITLSPGITQDHEILFESWFANDTNLISVLASPSYAGAAASDTGAIILEHAANGRVTSNRVVILSARASGVTDVLKYRVGANTGAFQQRRMNGKAI